jgi:radical SAM superfamily enzyme YgiQ (UPF0313 family)
MSRVLIVNMPFAGLGWPSLGPSLLKASLTRRGIACDVAYLSFDLAEQIGLDDYTWIAESFGFVLGGERLFARHYFRGRLPDDESYYRDVLLAADPGLSPQDRADYERLGAAVEPFLEHCLLSIDWSQYAIVGFALSFQQTMPSISLARRVKQLWPGVPIVLGGAACDGPMGIELLRQFPELDYVFLGEADLTFPPVVEQILSGGPVRLPPGVASRESLAADPTIHGDCPSFRGRGACGTLGQGPIGRENGTVPLACATSCPELARVMGNEASLVRRMDELPYPDFDDYFARLRASPLAGRIDPLVFFETARGCWWGQKHHCAFCGLNGSTLTFRSKSPRRAIDELHYLAGRYPVRRACAADNILDFRYFDTLLPELARAGLPLALVYEMKANLTRRHVQVLRSAGLGAAQVGIESFSTGVLRAIGKGATACQNLQALKWLTEAGIEVKWNLLYGIPGEDPADYRAMAELIPSLVHLAPPQAIGRVRLDRFSPYFCDPVQYGIVHPRPHRAFGHVYPFKLESLARLAYYFEFDYADGRNPADYAAPLVAAVEAWQQVHAAATLRCDDRPDGVLVLHDTRPCAAAFQQRLTGWERAIYLFCDAGRRLNEVLALAATTGGDPPPTEPAVRRLLDRWIAERIMARLDDCHLSLALRAL